MRNSRSKIAKNEVKSDALNLIFGVLGPSPQRHNLPSIRVCSTRELEEGRGGFGLGMGKSKLQNTNTNTTTTVELKIAKCGRNRNRVTDKDSEQNNMGPPLQK
ncbi:hypothetical protein VNO77_24312 [Canavalia gladiata]|uniref:Uncharacterized protein n=1 Tax=Canavalia gladiata TaxID=3824 RepID=A0AAN9QCD5_CANGL